MININIYFAVINPRRNSFAATLQPTATTAVTHGLDNNALLLVLFPIRRMSGNVGVPIKLLYEAEGMKISVEMKNGEIYRGLLLGAEDTMNVSLSEVLRTARNGKISKLPNVYLRGSSIRFIALPDLLKSAPLFQKVQTQKRKMEEAAAQRQGGTKKRKIAG